MFCNLDDGRVIFQDRLVIAFWDAFPVSPGHALIIPRRHVMNWFEATPEEHIGILQAVQRVREEIEQVHQPDGYNLGINIGEAAGQTIFHLHVHVIPRYRGDVADPTGGVRAVIPQLANYRREAEASTTAITRSVSSTMLATGGEDPLLPRLIAVLDQASQIDMAVAFVQRSGVDLLLAHLRDLLSRGGRTRILTGDYLNATDPEALLQLLDLRAEFPAQFELRVYESTQQGFHPKAYLLSTTADQTTAFVGSSNLSRQALLTGIEWNYRFDAHSDLDSVRYARRTFELLFQHAATTDVTDEWISAYRERRAAAIKTEPAASLLVKEEPSLPLPTPHRVQQEALDALRSARASGARAGLVVLATGLGKTWLAAFDSQAARAQRILFVAHREEILSQAIHTFRLVHPTGRLGRFQGEEKTTDVDVLFASVQTLGRARYLEQFEPNAFDYIVVDEFHHAAAETYRRIIDHFAPKFLLGLTATPERSDGGDLLGLCHNQLIYRCDIARGIEEELLSPFSYYGVPDEVDYTNIPWRSHRFDLASLTQALATQERAKNALRQYQRLAGTPGLARTLGNLG